MLAKLDATPLALEVVEGPAGPAGPAHFTVGGDALRFIVAKFYLNDPDNFRYLPKLLDEIDQGRRPWSLIFNLGQLSRGAISFTWFTTDGASGVSPARAATIRAQASSARLRDAMNFPFPDIDRTWRMRDLGEAFRAPVRSDVPTLFVAGTLDGITPVSQARDVLAGFSQGRLLVVENGGHTSQLRAPGVPTAIATFLGGGVPPATARLAPVSFAPLVTAAAPK